MLAPIGLLRNESAESPSVYSLVISHMRTYAVGMALKTVTFRSPEEKISALDRAAAIHQRDRTFILNEAVDQYLSLQAHHYAQIEEGLRQSETEEGMPHEEVVAMLEVLSQKLKKKQGMSKKRA